MKKILIITLILCIGGFVYAQQYREPIGSGDPNFLGADTADMMLREVSVDKFEIEGFWRSRMSSDEGYTTSRLFEGGPSIERRGVIQDEAGLNLPEQRYVLGTRVDFLRRGYSSFHIYPTRPIPIEGITKYVTVWVAGRNFNHRLFLLVQDYFGRNYEFIMRQDGGGASLNFQGWQRMYAVIPTASIDDTRGVAQRSPHFTNNFGLKITGFRIECDPLQARGSYYIYLDDLRAWTDLFTEYYRDDPDDMFDGW